MSPCALSLTREADPAAILQLIEVFTRKGMSSKAMGLLGYGATPRILARGHHFEMAYVDAATVSAQMVYVHSLWDFPALIHVRKSVCVSLLPTDPDQPVPLRRQRAKP